MSLELTDILIEFFCKEAGGKVTRYFVCMIPIIALDGKYLENDDHGVYDNLDYLIESETSYRKADKKAKELKKSFRSENYKIMIVENRLIKRK